MEIKKLIKEGRLRIQDKFIDMLMEIKSVNPDLNNDEIMDTIKSEFDRFKDYHTKDDIKEPIEKKEKDYLDTDNPNNKRGVFYDKMPTRKIAYNKKR